MQIITNLTSQLQHKNTIKYTAMMEIAISFLGETNDEHGWVTVQTVIIVYHIIKSY